MKKKLERLIVKTKSRSLINLTGFVYGFLFPAKKSYSQYAEDLVIENFFNSVGIYNDGFYVDIGAYHPKFISNTHRLHKKGWKGLCVDLSDEKLMWFRFLRKDKVSTVCAAVTPEESDSLVTFYAHHRILSEMDTLVESVAKQQKREKGFDYSVETVQGITVDSLLSQVGENVDFLNIDVEGLDTLILENIDLQKFQPKVILFEDNNVFGGSTHVKSLLVNNGYELLFKSGGSVAYYLSSLKSSWTPSGKG